MTERQRQMIEDYIPNPRDESLGFNEYYYLQYTSSGGERVIKVRVHEILPHDDHMEYGVYTKSGRIDVGDPFRGVRKHDLYDNKEDCRNQTHLMWDDWEELRALQEREEANGTLD